MRKLWNRWIALNGCPFYLLSDQGSNVDGATIRDLCKELGIEKRRSSAYHSQGNGFAERKIRSIREVLRTIILEYKLPRSKWWSLLPEATFALNTKLSASTKCVPFNVVFGRNPTLPEDVQIGLKNELLDVQSTDEYLHNVKNKLKGVVSIVREHLKMNQCKTRKVYDKKVTKRHVYDIGVKVWLKKKSYMIGEYKKLSPRKTGPWTIIVKLDNYGNFKIKKGNDEKVVHYNSLIPMKGVHLSAIRWSDERDEIESSHVDKMPRDEESGTIEHFLDTSEESELESDHCPDSEDVDNPNSPERRYPLRAGSPRRLPEKIPWGSIEGDEGRNVTCNIMTTIVDHMT